MTGLIVISGCSGGGKSTLLAELARRGFVVVEEPGRRIVKEELARDGSALPWVDLAAFAHRAIAMANADLSDARKRGGWTFFDRGLVDAAVALRHVTGEPISAEFGFGGCYDRRVFLAPPWPEIYETDPERRHDMDDSVAEYERLASAYPSLGYEVILLPKTDVASRADFLLDCLQ